MILHPLPPHDMAQAMRDLADPAAHGCNLAVIQSAWAFLKEARGQNVNHDRLTVPGHLIERAAPAPTQVREPANDIDRRRIAAIPAIRAAVARVFHQPTDAA